MISAGTRLRLRPVVCHKTRLWQERRLCDANLKGPWERVWWPWSSVGNLCSWVRLCRGTSQSSEHALSLSSSDFWWLCIFLICLYFSPLCSRLIPSNLSPLPLIGVDLSGAEGRPPLPHLIGLTLVNYRSVVGCMEKGVGLNEVILLLTPFGIRNKMLLCFLLFIACKYYFLTVHVFFFCLFCFWTVISHLFLVLSINQSKKENNGNLWAVFCLLALLPLLRNITAWTPD